MNNGFKILRTVGSSALGVLLLFTLGLAEPTHTVHFVNGMMEVRSLPNERGVVQVFSVPLDQVRLDSVRAGSSPGIAGDRTGRLEPQPSGPLPSESNPQATTTSSFAFEVLRYTNEARARQGLRPLQMNSGLTEAARSHTQEMLNLNYFSHTSPVRGRRSPSARVALTGISPSFVTENIFQAEGYPIEEMAKLAVDNWLESSGHRRNILSTSATHIGIGLIEKQGKIAVTQVFGAGL